ncbi:MAG: hypothetical protein M3Z83_05865 [Actinomycetota bacterium]|nr:hypothetical protein [Actinomycetota bacterium]
MSVLVLDDEQGYADLATFVGRARTVDAEGAMHLTAFGTTLTAHVGVLPGRGLLGEGTVTGMRVMALGEPSDVDVVVSLASLADRFARQPVGRELAVPPVTVTAVWASLAPRRSGWEPVGELPHAALELAARTGIAEVAQGSAPSSGGAAVAMLRQSVWGRLTETAPPVPAGAAFAAYVLGFLEPDGMARVLTHGRWVRVATRRGHVLVR